MSVITSTAVKDPGNCACLINPNTCTLSFFWLLSLIHTHTHCSALYHSHWFDLPVRKQGMCQDLWSRAEGCVWVYSGTGGGEFINWAREIDKKRERERQRSYLQKFGTVWKPEPGRMSQQTILRHPLFSLLYLIVLFNISEKVYVKPKIYVRFVFKCQSHQPHAQTTTCLFPAYNAPPWAPWKHNPPFPKGFGSRHCRCHAGLLYPSFSQWEVMTE